MANANAPTGFKPVRYRDGRCYNGAATLCFDATNAALYIGDPVIFSGTGDTPGTHPGVQKATAAGGNYISGVVVGFAPDPTDLTKTYFKAADYSPGRYVFVATDPDLMFEIQEDSVGGALATTACEGNADWVDGSGSTTSGKSGVMLDSSTLNTTNTLQLRVHSLVNREDNALGNYAKWLVSINLHSNNNTTGV